MYSVGRDLRYGVRLLWNAPAFTVMSLVTLGLGMGASTAIFSVVDAVLLKPLPFRDPRGLLVIWEKHPVENKFKLFVAASNVRDWQQQSRTLEAMAAVMSGRINLTGGPNGRIDPEEVRVERVTNNLFPLLGVQAILGRSFLPEEDQPGHTDYVLVSHRLWERRFGSDPAIAGKAILLSARPYTVVGVLPAEFSVKDPEVDLWLPLGLNPSIGGRTLMVVARMKPGVTIQQARAEMEAIGERLEKSNPAQNTGWRPSLFPLQDELVGNVREPLLVLMAAVGFLLLMACANVANLLLTRGAIRRKEMAVRTALGATRGRIVFQLLAESVKLSLAGGLFGLLLARAGMLLLAKLGPESIPRLAEARLDIRLFLFAMSVSVVTGALFGIVPAIQISGIRLHQALAEGGRSGTTGRGGRMVRNALVVVEVALAVVVLIGAGLLIRSFQRLRSADAGFQPSGLLTFRLPLAGGRNTALGRRIAFFQQVLDRVGALPGVQSVGAVSSLPLTGLWDGSQFAVDGRPAPPPGHWPSGLVRAVTPAYFTVMAIPPIAGRMFAAADTMQAPTVLIVNQTLARRFWPQGNPVGGRLLLPNGRTAEIVGVVGDVKPDRIEGEEWPTLYGPYSQLPYLTMVMVVRTAGPQPSLASAIQREVHQLDPDQPLTDMRPMESIVDRAIAGARFNTLLLGIFAAIAFVLAAVGIYGVIACDVSERTHEIGIRVALGAQSGDVLKLVVGQGARLAACGIALGLAAAFALTRLMASMLYSVKATDAFTFALISLLLGGVALAASYLPSRRAMALDPVAALRHE